MSAPGFPIVDDVWNAIHALVEARAEAGQALADITALSGNDRDDMLTDLADLRAAAIVVTHRCLDAGEQELVKLRMTDRLARWGMRDAPEPDDNPELAA
jgi:hypothetical protein